MSAERRESSRANRKSRDAGYSANKPENAGKAAIGRSKTDGDCVRDAMDQAGFTLEQLIDKDLRSVLEAKETRFFPWRRTVRGKTEQIIDTREVVNLATKATGLDIAFRLRGDYAPKKLDFDPEGVPVKVINLGGIPRHNA